MQKPIEGLLSKQNFKLYKEGIGSVRAASSNAATLSENCNEEHYSYKSYIYSHIFKGETPFRYSKR